MKEKKPEMDSRSRFALAVTVTVVGAVGLVLALVTSPDVLPRESPPAPRTALSRPAVASASPRAEAVASAAVRAPAAQGVPPASEGSSQAVSAEEAPENDPILPELPQTPEWRHGKLVRITSLLERDVTRLEAERERARARGDADEARRLEVQVLRHRARLESLRAESAALGSAATVAEATAP